MIMYFTMISLHQVSSCIIIIIITVAFLTGISVGSSNISPPGSSHDNDPLMDSYKPSNEAELLGLVRQQLEYYFSKDNISADKYLCKSNLFKNYYRLISLCPPSLPPSLSLPPSPSLLYPSSSSVSITNGW